MKMRTILLTVLAATLAITSAFADEQADWVKRLLEWPVTKDFSRSAWSDQDDDQYDKLLENLAEADAIVYFQTHRHIIKDDMLQIGDAHAIKHHLMGQTANSYSIAFLTTLDALLTDR
jgi:hypothetical protein